MSQNIEVQSIHVYPIKSCGGIDLTTAQMEDRGFAYDRNWMIVEPDGTKLTQREIPEMALIHTELTDEHLILQHGEQQSPLSISLEREPADAIHVDIWGHKCMALDEGKDAAAWLSSVLQKEVRLVRFDPGHFRAVDSDYAGKSGAHTGFADMLPYLITATESLEALNEFRRQDGLAPSRMNRFRPNIVISGAGAFAEHTIQALSLPGKDAQFDLVRSCSRCPITNVDQETALREDPKSSNLSLLGKHRRFANNDGKKRAMFGVQAIGTGTAGQSLSIGDTLEITAISAGLPPLPEAH